MDPIQNLSNDFTAWVAPLFAISLALVIGMALRDWATNLVLGMKFKYLKIERVIDRPRAAHAKHSDHSNGGS